MYISVLGRKKEIGILRAIEVSKRHVSQLFNAKIFIMRLLAGLLVMGITFILLIPGNMLIHQITGNTMVSATLSIAGAVILMVLSVILTLIGEFIAFRKATQEKPVDA